MIVNVSTSEPLEWGLSGKDRIIQNVLNMLRTRKYQVPFMRGVGVDTESIDSILSYVENNIEDDITEMIEDLEPRVSVLNIEISGFDSNGNVNYLIELEV